MPSYEDFFGNYLKKSDIEGDVPVTVVKVVPETVGQGKEAKEKLVCYLKEFDKPVILNQGNCSAIAEVAGSDNFDDWKGKTITLFVDPTVKFGLKTVGGIRVRVPSQGVQPK